jgi:hypothetical protein
MKPQEVMVNENGVVLANIEMDLTEVCCQECEPDRLRRAAFWLTPAAIIVDARL